MTASVPIWFDGLAVGQGDVAANGCLSLRYGTLNARTPDAAAAYHFLTSRGENDIGFCALFQYLREVDVPSAEQARQAIRRLLDGQTCDPALETILDEIAIPAMKLRMAA